MNMPPSPQITTFRAAGGVVVSTTTDGQPCVLLIQDRYGHWTLPKGHLHAGESEEAAAQREIAEETSIACTVGPLVERIHYQVYKRGTWHDKTVAFFLCSAAHSPPRPDADEAIRAAQWIDPSRALELISYPQVREVLRRALLLLDAAPLHPS